MVKIGTLWFDSVGVGRHLLDIFLRIETPAQSVCQSTYHLPIASEQRLQVSVTLQNQLRDEHENEKRERERERERDFRQEIC